MNITTIAGPYLRIFIPLSALADTLTQYKNTFDAVVDFHFHNPHPAAEVYQLSSSMGLFCIFASDEQQPEIIKHTIATYSVKDLDRLLWEAENNGFEIPQPKTAVGAGFQARIKLADKQYIELVEWHAPFVKKLLPKYAAEE